MKKNLLLITIIIGFAGYSWYMSERHSYDRVLIKQLNSEITKINETIADLKKQLIVSKFEKNRSNTECKKEVEQVIKEVFIDCAKPIDIISTKYKEVKPVKIKKLPELDSVRIDDVSKLRIAPVFTPDDKFSGATMTLETKF